MTYLENLKKKFTKQLKTTGGQLQSHIVGWVRQCAAINQLIHSALKCEKKNPQFAYIAPTYGQAKSV